MLGFVRQALLSLVLLTSAAPAWAGIHAEWIGQDQHDLVNPSANVGPSDTQDVHIRLDNLPAKEITHARITRLGGGEWQYKGPWGAWAIAIERKDNAGTADLYLEPSHHEDGATWDITVDYADKTQDHTRLKTGKIDPNLRMPGAVLSAKWIGQDGRDWTGRYAAVGPDGIQDVVLRISGISDKLGKLNALRVEAEGGPIWEWGVNPDRVWNAEIIRDPKNPREADMLMSPPLQSIDGKPLKLTIWYGQNRDHEFTGTAVAGKSDPDLKTPRPKIYDVKPIKEFSAKWFGQDGKDVTGRGDVHVRVSGLPATNTIVGASLSDNVGGDWLWKASDKVDYYVPAQGETRHLAFQSDPHDASAADLFFPPFRDEADTHMTFRVLLSDGSMRFAQFTGEKCDTFHCGKAPNDKTITAKPGDDLAAMAREYGKITLTPGIYEIDHPLELNEPVTITGDREAILRFNQPASDKPWHGAIYVGADNVNLVGFTVRFAGPARFDVRLGAAIIRSNERGDTTGGLVNLVIRNMDIETPPFPPLKDPSKPYEAPYLIRVGRILSGQIIGNTLSGGTIDVVHGPWVISDNTHLGLPAGGIGWDAFAAHYSHDLRIERNKLHADTAGAKLWRFFTSTQYAAHSIVRDNDVRGVGMRDNDPMPNPNAPEIFLTEAYRLHYEGHPVYQSDDRLVLQIPVLMWGEVRPGCIVAILDGEHAGEWYKIAQAIDPVSYLMDRPMPPGHYAISISTGNGR